MLFTSSMYSNVTTSTRINILQCTYVHLRLFHLKLHFTPIMFSNGLLTNNSTMCIMRTLSAVALDIFLPNRQCQCHPYVISSTLYISYHVQLSFCTLSAQMHIVHVICMLSRHVHIICLSSLPLLIYLIIHNLVSIHCLHTCILCVMMLSVYCLEMHMLCTFHLSYFVVFL